ncbi:hypothetical protein [Haloplanus aerogenes]|uniref:Uncharacterized protein n=1 Tax=Haloplanus aerogenes TaxID=660522 RepID=A0A3G8QN36_9EURY|nr:hypothetical protein [Haloplanus aerogenes]AZH23873.1 hypothetical protein DU502_00125 [Haloplanus aerogenes]
MSWAWCGNSGRYGPSVRPVATGGEDAVDRAAARARSARTPRTTTVTAAMTSAVGSGLLTAQITAGTLAANSRLTAALDRCGRERYDCR